MRVLLLITAALATAKPLAVVVTGQLSRLELESKMQHVVAPYASRGRRVGVFLHLSSGAARYVNANKTTGRRGEIGRLGVGPYANFSAAELREEACRLAERRRCDVATGPLFVDVFISPPTIPRYLLDRAWAEKLDKFDFEKNARRQRLHMHQWAALREAMFMVDRAEQTAAGHYATVLKLRDDSLALAPFEVPNRPGIVSLNCLDWGGISDTVFVVSRPYAWRVLEGMSADWYLLHGQLSKKPRDIPTNPETWFKALATTREIPLTRVSVCNLPFMSVRFMATGRLVAKLSHRRKLLHGKQCANDEWDPAVSQDAPDTNSDHWTCRPDTHPAVFARLKSVAPCSRTLCSS